MQAGARAAQPRVSLFSRRDYAQYEFIQKWFKAQKPAELLRMNKFNGSEWFKRILDGKSSKQNYGDER